jgi:hypothetical protein
MKTCEIFNFRVFKFPGRSENFKYFRVEMGPVQSFKNLKTITDPESARPKEPNRKLCEMGPVQSFIKWVV